MITDSTKTASGQGDGPLEVVIPARFNGPPASGNGGYSCGLLAAFIDGPARVRLHVPPPLDTPLQVSATEGGAVQMYDGQTLVGTGVAAPLELDIPAAPSLAEAEQAMTRFPCYDEHLFGTCFVCGADRPGRDGLQLFTGALTGDGGMQASPWQPAPDLLDDAGNVRPEILWSALDCPGYFASMGDELRPAVLGELAAELFSPVGGEQPLVVYAWPLGKEGRKYYAGTAVATVAGAVVAASRSTWIALQV